MDERIRKWIENASGLPIKAFPDDGVHIQVSPARIDQPENRLRIQRITEKNGVLITVIPRLLEAIKNYTRAHSAWEIFSPFGLAELKRALPSSDAASLEEYYGLDYFLSDSKDFHPAAAQHAVAPLKKKDIPPGEEASRLAERRSTEKDDFTWAFACYHNDPSIPAKVFQKYGPCYASIAGIFWKGDDIAGLGVATEEGLRGQGYAADVVSKATGFILSQGGIPWYGAYANNIPSLRIAKRLGFSLIHSSICV